MSHPELAVLPVTEVLLAGICNLKDTSFRGKDDALIYPSLGDL